MKNEDYYKKTITTLNSDKKALEEQLRNTKSESKNIMSQKTKLEEWNKILFWLIIFLLVFLLAIFYEYTKKNDELQSLKEQRHIAGPTEKMLARADSIFNGVYCLYPTDTAVMIVGNQYGDTVKVLITNP